MKKKEPSIEIDPKEFYNLIIEKIKNPCLIPEGDWLPPEIILDGYIVNNKITLEDQLEFNNIDFNRVRITFLNCRLKGRYIFKNINLRSITFLYTEINVIHLSECIFEVFSFILSSGLAISIDETDFKQFMEIRDGNVTNAININKATAKSQISIRNIDSKNLSIVESKGELYLENGNCTTVKILNNNLKLAKIFSSNNKNLSVSTPLIIENNSENFKIEKLELSPNFNNSAIISGKSLNLMNIDEVELSDSIFSNIKITFDHISVVTFKIIRVVNSGSISLFNIKSRSEKSCFHVEGSFLGPTKIFNCDFGKFNKFIFKQSDIREISYNNVAWPDNLSDEDPLEKVEVYKQLKHIANKNNDSINSVRFYSIEKSAFYNMLNWTWKDSGTKIIFLLNKLSNNYNLSWVQPILINIFIQFLIFISILIYINGTCILNYSNFIEEINPIFRFLYMLNPVYKTEEINSVISNFNFTIILITISRIASAYLIYQTISAFRRHN